MTTLNLERTRPEQNEADAARHHRDGSSVQASSAGLSTRGRRVLVGLGTAAAALIAVAMLGSPSSPAQSAATPTAWEQERLATQVRGTPVAATPTAWEQERLATQVRGTPVASTPTAWEQERLATQVRGTPVASTPTAWEQERVATQVNGTA